MSIIIIGAGLFGSLIARGLMAAGYAPLVLDDQQPLRGSAPAACLIKKEWCGKLPVGVYQDGMVFLRKHFKVQQVDFGVAGKADWVDPRDMLLPEGYHNNKTGCFLRARVNHVLPTSVGKWTVSGTGEEGTFVYGADVVIVAAGVWSQALMPSDVNLEITAKAGSAVLFEGTNVSNFMDSWAPYKQLVGFNRGDGFWVGDGSAILQKNYTDKREKESVARSVKAYIQHKRYQGGTSSRILTGLRPYVDTEPCRCEEVKPGLWVAVGARKNGTLLGAWCAQRIVKNL